MARTSLCGLAHGPSGQHVLFLAHKIILSIDFGTRNLNVTIGYLDPVGVSPAAQPGPRLQQQTQGSKRPPNKEGWDDDHRDDGDYRAQHQLRIPEIHVINRGRRKTILVLCKDGLAEMVRC